MPLGIPDWRAGVPRSRRRRSAQSALSSLRRALASPARAGLPGRPGPAALPVPPGHMETRPAGQARPVIAGAVLAAVFAVAPVHATQAADRPALAGNGVSQTDSNGVITADHNGVIHTDGIQGSGA